MSPGEFVEAVIVACLDDDWDDEMRDLFEERALRDYGPAIRDWANWHVKREDTGAAAIAKCVEVLRPAVVRSIEISRMTSGDMKQKFVGWFACDSKRRKC